MDDTSNSDNSVHSNVTTPSDVAIQNSGLSGLSDLAASLRLIANSLEIQSKTMEKLESILTKLGDVTRDSPKSVSTDKNGDIVITSYDVPSNHLKSENSFKANDVDVERFLSKCKQQFEYYANFYSSEKKKVEFIEAHLGNASEWYYAFMAEAQRTNPDSKFLLDELADVFLNSLPSSVKFKRLKELKHKWGNAIDFITKFKLYTTQLKIPEVVQLEMFEDRVNPLVKQKLLDLEPDDRTIEKYCKSLLRYDSERDRHWNFDSKKRGYSQVGKDNENNKKFKYSNNKSFSGNQNSKGNVNGNRFHKYKNKYNNNNNKDEKTTTNNNFKSNNNNNYKTFEAKNSK